MGGLIVTDCMRPAGTGDGYGNGYDYSDGYGSGYGTINGNTRRRRT